MASYSNLTLDLDLLVFDANNNLVGSSESWDNSYEIAEFSAYPNTTYTIKIRRWTGSNDTWFGIAWNVYGFIFDVDPAPVPVIWLSVKFILQQD